jgi:hypothetical protein
LLAERDELLNEVNALRTIIALGNVNIQVTRPLISPVMDFMQHEQEFVLTGVSFLFVLILPASMILTGIF